MELNAFLFLDRMSHKYGRRLSLAEIPEEEWGAIAAQGFDYVWLMGVWMRSPGARKRALEEPALRDAYTRALPGWKEEDIPGSPYAIYYYEIDPRLGKGNDLAAVRDKMRGAGLGLILDFVPNHMALDHVWTQTQPDCFVQTNAETAHTHSDLFFTSPEGRYFAYGRDPYFPAWTDTVQINFFAPVWRRAAVEILLKVAEVSDGVRCDMAMLGLNDVFRNVWDRFLRGSPRPSKEFWEEVISAVKVKYPDFLFMAEAYWNKEWQLQQLGFELTYDKSLYDRLSGHFAQNVRGHLLAEKEYQEKSVRFIENHDEPRAVVEFGREKSRAAAVVAMTVPGARFVQDGQIEGKKVRVPVQMGKEPEEAADTEIRAFYKILLQYASQKTLHDGQWRLLEVTPESENDQTYLNLMAWTWQDEKNFRLVVVNYSSSPSQGRLKISEDWLGSRGTAQLLDKITGTIYQNDLDPMTQEGLWIQLKPWKAHLFEAKKISDRSDAAGTKRA